MDDENSSLDYDYDAAPHTGSMPVIAEGMSSLEDWTEMRREYLPGLADDPLTATFSDLDLEPARAALPVEFNEDFWAV